jgi:hypothetical protein
VYIHSYADFSSICAYEYDKSLNFFIRVRTTRGNESILISIRFNHGEILYDIHSDDNVLIGFLIDLLSTDNNAFDLVRSACDYALGRPDIPYAVELANLILYGENNETDTKEAK